MKLEVVIGIVSVILRGRTPRWSARGESGGAAAQQATHSSAVKLPMLVLNVAVTRPAAAAMWRTGAAVRRCAEILERANIVVLVVW